MIVTYHRYNKVDKIAAGASFYYYEVSKLFNSHSEKDIEFIPHNINDVANNEIILSKLKKDDVLFSNIGPYSWYYYYLREKRGYKFKIIHDVQTALFRDHLLQEALCGDYMREGDKVLFLSEYQRRLYIKIFQEHLNQQNTFVCNPLLKFFPQKTCKKENKGLVLGWVGRVFDAKNFDQALDTFIGVYQRLKDTKMVVCGLADNKYQPDLVKRKLKENRVNPKNYIHLNRGYFTPREKMWDVWSKIDVLLFPSVANMESLGRVVLEANYTNTPVLAAHHGATPEIVKRGNLLDVEYFREEIELDENHSMGKIDKEEMIERCCDHKKLKISDCEPYKNHDKKLIRIIKGIERKEKGREITQKVKNFIEDVEVRLNADYELKKQEALKKALKALEHQTKIDIANTSNLVCSTLNYRPEALVMKRVFPKLIVLEITRNCNLNCEMCFNKDNHSWKDNLKTFEIKNLLRQAKDMGVEILSLTGGEPFLRKDLSDIISYAEKIGIQCVVFTNGQLINSKLCEDIINSNLSRIFFSIDGIKPELNDDIRKGGSLKKTINAINMLIKKKKERGSDIEIRIGTTIMGINLEELIPLTIFGRKLGVDGITFKPVRVHECYARNGIIERKVKDNINIEDIWVKPSQYKLLDLVIDYLINYKKKYGFVWDKVEYLSLIKEYFRNPYNSLLKLRCGSYDSFLVIDKDGNVRPCWGVDWGDVGNIKNRTLYDIWNSDYYKKIRKDMCKCELPCYNILIHKTHLR